MPDLAQILIPVLTAVSAFILGILKHRNSLIDQLQEERKAMTTRLDEVGLRVDTVYAAMHLKDIYVGMLIAHINSGLGPPAPQPPAPPAAAPAT